MRTRVCKRAYHLLLTLANGKNIVFRHGEGVGRKLIQRVSLCGGAQTDQLAATGALLGARDLQVGAGEGVSELESV